MLPLDLKKQRKTGFEQVDTVCQPSKFGLRQAISAAIAGVADGTFRLDGKSCGKGFIAAGKQCLQKTPNGKIVYRGKEFDEFNRPTKSDRAGKKRMVLVKKGDRVKLVHYGATGYKHNYSESAKRNYLARSAGIKNKDGKPTKDDIFSPNYWARRDLWSKRKPADGSTKFGI